MFLQQIINGLTIGSTYALVAIGFSMVYGILELTNLAHNAVFMLGAYIAAFILIQSLPPVLAILASIVGCGMIGIMLDRFALMPMRKNGAIRSSYLTCTIGFSTFLQNLIIILFGAEAIPFPDVFDRTSITVGGAIVSYLQIMIFALTIVLMVATTFVVNKTKMGRSMTAVAQNQIAARLTGINIDQVITFTFFFGSALAAISGVMVGMYYRSVDTTFGFTVGTKTIASAVIGGIGVLPGAVVGGLLIGIAESLFAGYVNASFKDAVAFILLILVLLLKPEGLMGKKRVNKV